MKQYDIIIIGAGPAGCAAALSLRNSKQSIALFDKASFPRPKICGDGLCDRTINSLRAISETYYHEFLRLPQIRKIEKTALIYKARTYLLDFNAVGYTCSRSVFDNFLFSLVQRDCPSLDVFQNTAILAIKKVDKGYQLTDSNKQLYHTKLLIVANGAKSAIAQQLTGIGFSNTQNGVAIRAYFKGISDMQNDTIELHYKKEYFPGYLWIFPMNDDTANVGFGYHLQDKQRFSSNIQTLFREWIANDPKLNARFANAEQLSNLQGGLIPYNANQFNCYGDHFMICGDACSLVDPISGGGIGNALLSGHFAALQAEKCVTLQDFSHKQTANYAAQLRKRIEREISNRYFLHTYLARHRWLLDVVALIGKNAVLLSKIKKWYNK